jgi:hypothetical protein
MRGVGTAVNGVYPGYLRRIDPGSPVGLNGDPIPLWFLATNETAAQVEAANYFNAHAAALKKGSVILASLDVDGTIKTKQYVVTANDGTTVTIALQTTTAG